MCITRLAGATLLQRVRTGLPARRHSLASRSILRYNPTMQMPIKDVEDLRWLLGHTDGFRGGYVTDVQMSKRRLFD